MKVLRDRVRLRFGLRRWDASSECAHVSIIEVACYRLEMTLVGCTDPLGAPLELSKSEVEVSSISLVLVPALMSHSDES